MVQRDPAREAIAAGQGSKESVSHSATSPSTVWLGTHSPSCGLKDLRKEPTINPCPGHLLEADISKHTRGQ